MLEKVASNLNNISQIKPLILCITNVVTVELVANSLLAIGAAPIMSYEKTELADLIAISSAVYINIGTLNHDFIDMTHEAIKIAKKCQKLIVLDPVGAGASLLRTEFARELVLYSDIIRGNASEILALIENQHTTRGVETIHKVEHALSAAYAVAKNNKSIVVVSGPKDFITDGMHEFKIGYGDEIMQYITGMGCALTSVITAFAACAQDRLNATKNAVAYFNLCATLAKQNTNAPNSFRIAFLDNLYLKDLKQLEKVANEV